VHMNDALHSAPRFQVPQLPVTLTLRVGKRAKRVVIK
jgi:hypothetical protein